MQDERTKLQTAFDRGFVPADLREAMEANGHVGQVWITGEQEVSRPVKVGETDDGQPIIQENHYTRIGVGYKLANLDGTEQSHVVWYEPEEVQKMLEGLGSGQNNQV